MERPERVMVRRALLGGGVAVPLAYGLGHLIHGSQAGLSAAAGVALVVLNFAAHGASLAWAAGVSISAVHAVALGGFAVRMGVVLLAMFLLSKTAFFVPPAFGLGVVVATLSLLVYEARLLLAFRTLDIPPDGAAVRAHRALMEKEAAAR